MRLINVICIVGAILNILHNSAETCQLTTTCKSICEELNPQYTKIITTAGNHNNQRYEHIPKHIHAHIKPYLMSAHHSMKAPLDTIFANGRITTSKQTFIAAGFNIIATRPRSFICVAKHHLLPQHLVKVNFDNILCKKRNKDSWKWLVQRCKGAKKIKQIIENYKIKHFIVASKWMYYLPPATYGDSDYQEHIALLCVTDMNLTSDKKNYEAWHEKITPEHLRELYIIITEAKGSSYRPDNIAYTNTGQFAFIDTEYPDSQPDYSSIVRYLNPSMQRYWNKLVQHGQQKR